MLLKFNKSSISNISCVIPSNEINLIDYSKVIGISKDEAKRIIKTTGFEKINIAKNDETSSDLCQRAYENIINNDNSIHNNIEAIIFVSQTPDYSVPQTSNILQHKLGLSSEVLTFDLRIGCSGYVYGLLQANLLINAGLGKVLLLAGDTSTKFINPKDKTVSMVFGDAGSATIIEKSNDKNNYDSFFEMGSDGSKFNKLIINDGGYRNLLNENSFKRNKIADGVIRSNIDLYMDGMAIMNFAIEEVPKSINKLINYSKIDRQNIDKIILHQANKFMIRYLCKKMKFNNDALVPFLGSKYGNTGPSSIPLALCELFNSFNHKRDNFILSGFGIGLSWASCLLNLNNTKFHKILNK